MFLGLKNEGRCVNIKFVNAQQEKVVEVVAAVVYDGEGRVLATKCAPHKHGGGWEFPGGKIEPGEAARDAVVREMQEELNVTVQVGELLHTVEWNYPSFHLRMFCYACSIKDGKLQLRELMAYRWLTRGELYDVEWLPADVVALPAVAAKLEK